MAKDTEPGVVIPASPYGGHPAGQRWYLERYQIEHSAMEGKSTRDLQNAVNNLGAIHPTDPSLKSDMQASHQAAVDVLKTRQNGKG